MKVQVIDRNGNIIPDEKLDETVIDGIWISSLKRKQKSIQSNHE